MTRMDVPAGLVRKSLFLEDASLLSQDPAVMSVLQIVVGNGNGNVETRQLAWEIVK
jgi:hypothetical protein